MLMNSLKRGAPQALYSTSLLALAWFSPTAHAQTSGLPIDLNTTPTAGVATLDQGVFLAQPSLNDPKTLTPTSSFVEQGGVWYFTAGTPALGRELYRTDGTALGTFLAKDVLPGAASSSPAQFTEYQGDLYFVDTAPAARQLWKRDAATGQVLSLGVVGDSENDFFDARMVVAGGKLLFVGKNAATGYELWQSDGTPAGTKPLIDLSVGQDSTLIRHLFADAAGQLAYFVAEQGDGTRAVWRTDGTAAGTFVLQATGFVEEPSDRAPEWISALNGQTVFLAYDAVNGWDLFSTDGTVQGTQLFVDLTPGQSVYASVNFRDAVSFQGEVYFQANVPGTGNELWKSDGTAAGTQLAVDVRAGAVSGDPFGMTVFGNALYFVARSTSLGRELHRWDGQNLSVIDLQPGLASSFLLTYDRDELVATSQGLFFRSGILQSNEELWVSDGTLAGSHQVADIDPNGSSTPHSLTPMPDGRVLFAATDGAGVVGLYAADNQSAQLIEALDAGPATESSRPSLISEVAPSVLLMRADLQAGDPSIVRLSPKAGVEAVIPAQSFDLTSGPFYFETNDRSLMLYSGQDALGQAGVFVAEGSAASATWLGALVPAQVGVLIHQAVEMGGDLYFFATSVSGTSIPAIEQGLWRTDGTAAGTTKVLGQAVANLTAGADRVVFTTLDPMAGDELWSSDGTPAGTQLLIDLDPGVGSPAFTSVVSALDQVAVVYSVAGTTPLLLVTDGTLMGTTTVTTQQLGLVDSVEPVEWQGQLFFVAGVPLTGIELYVTDGTLAGTRRVKDVWPGPIGSLPELLVAGVDGLYFSALTTNGDREVFRTDGTADGTVQVSDLAATTPTNNIVSMVGLAEGVAFLAEVGGAQRLFTATAAGTQQIAADVPTGFGPSQLFGYDGGILLTGKDALVGEELFFYPTFQARAEAFSQGAGELVASAPRLGQTVVFESHGALPTMLSALAYSKPVVWPLQVAGLADQLLWLDAGSFQLFGMFAGANWSHPVAVPAKPALIGVHLNAQVLYLGAAGFPGELSNPVALTVGL